MAKIVFPSMSIFPSTGTLGVSTSTKIRIKIPHIVGTGDNGIPTGKVAKPLVTSATTGTGVSPIGSPMTTAVGGLLDGTGANGKVYRLREAVDIAGNNVPTTEVIPCTLTDITNLTVFPPLQYTTVQVVPAVQFSSSKFYEFEVEDELEYVLYNAIGDSVGIGGSDS